MALNETEEPATRAAFVGHTESDLGLATRMVTDFITGMQNGWLQDGDYHKSIVLTVTSLNGKHLVEFNSTVNSR